MKIVKEHINESIKFVSNTWGKIPGILNHDYEIIKEWKVIDFFIDVERYYTILTISKNNKNESAILRYYPKINRIEVIKRFNSNNTPQIEEYYRLKKYYSIEIDESIKFAKTKFYKIPMDIVLGDHPESDRNLIEFLNNKEIYTKILTLKGDTGWPEVVFVAPKNLLYKLFDEIFFEDEEFVDEYSSIVNDEELKQYTDNKELIKYINSLNESIKFKTWTKEHPWKGNIDLYDKILITLKNEKIPKAIDGNFKCNLNNLKTLEGAPEYVYGNFICNDNYLTSLEGGPKYVKNYFDCSFNYLTTLEGAPEYVGGNFNCGNNYDLPKSEIEKYWKTGAVKGKIISNYHDYEPYEKVNESINIIKNWWHDIPGFYDYLNIDNLTTWLNKHIKHIDHFRSEEGIYYILVKYPMNFFTVLNSDLYIIFKYGEKGLIRFNEDNDFNNIKKIYNKLKIENT